MAVQVVSQEPSKQRFMLSGQENAGVRGTSDGMHCNKTASKTGVLPVHWLARVCKYVLKSAAEAAHAAIEVWHWSIFVDATQVALGHFTGREGSPQYKLFKKLACCCCCRNVPLTAAMAAARAL